MAGFPLCPACWRECRDPGDRRFHAQPNACPACGPQLTLRDAEGHALAVDDVIAAAVEMLQTGRILAIKGLGGFHLVCDARNAAAVERLRQRKQRDAKPFAVMAANSASLAAWVDGDAEEWRLLETPQRPIVLLRRRADSPRPLGAVSYTHLDVSKRQIMSIPTSITVMSMLTSIPTSITIASIPTSTHIRTRMVVLALPPTVTPRKAG